MYLNTLGLVHYRLQNYEAGVAALKRNLETDAGTLAAFDWIVLALCHQGLGQTAKAHDCYFRAIQHQALARLPPEDQEEIRVLRGEADALFGKK
jgi:tetratricopeptide (TPR) repeat protein